MSLILIKLIKHGYPISILKLNEKYQLRNVIIKLLIIILKLFPMRNMPRHERNNPTLVCIPQPYYLYIFKCFGKFIIIIIIIANNMKYDYIKRLLSISKTIVKQ